MSQTHEGREISLLNSVLYPKCHFFFLPDLKSHKINSLETFSNHFCGLRVKTKTVPLRSFLTCTENPWLTPVWAVEFHPAKHLCGCLPQLVISGAPPLHSEPESPNGLVFTCLFGWAGTQMLASSPCNKIQAGYGLVIQSQLGNRCEKFL